MNPMKTAIFAFLTCSLFSGTSIADSMEANCTVYHRGDMKRDASGPCTVSQRQGYVGIELSNGASYELSPGNQANRYTDQDGDKVERRNEGGSDVRYVWPHSNVLVQYGQQNRDEEYGSSQNSGPAEWDRGCEDAKGGSYDRSRHSDAYEEGWQACKNEQPASDASGPEEWDRGCEDAKIGSYDRSSHSDAYEEGWQACNNN